MSNTRAKEIEKLIRENNIKQARIQLVENLLKYYNTDVSGKEFADYQISEQVFQKVICKNELREVNYLKFPSNEEVLRENIELIFDHFKKHNKDQVLFYPQTSRIPISDSNNLYLKYPTALALPLTECKSVIIKLMSEKNDEVTVVSEKLHIGIVIREDECSEVNIEYWGN
ncbi:hypothetical protein [Paenisporosarcina sp.]|uniref:hypothetical protein n=1 Tax=Paenisporosarcina sp. TaxID=1932001 RepID=UPI003C78487C